MDSTNRILNCDATSLLDLKAELYRKQEACKLAKPHQNFGPLKPMAIKGQSMVSKKRDKKAPETAETSTADTYEDDMLRKSRMILEAKAKMYDQIVEKKVALDEDFSDNYLVDFQRKELFERSEKNRESDVQPNQRVDPCTSEKNAALSENVASVENLESQITTFAEHHSLGTEPQNSCSSNLLEDKTETAEHQATDGPIHYQNVRFNEIRDHGVGYFAFSPEEKQRQEQMELLNALRLETVESKQAKEKLKQKKQTSLLSRLAKVCQRKNIDSSAVQVYTKEKENEEISEKVEPEQISNPPTDQANSNEPDSVSSVTSKKIRPWDIGKSNSDFPIQTSKNRQSGAEKWIEHKRKERNDEFGPPSFYFNSSEPKAKKFCKDN